MPKGILPRRHVRSKCRRSCFAVHDWTHSWLRPSSTHEPSDPPPRVRVIDPWPVSFYPRPRDLLETFKSWVGVMHPAGTTDTHISIPPHWSGDGTERYAHNHSAARSCSHAHTGEQPTPSRPHWEQRAAPLHKHSHRPNQSDHTAQNHRAWTRSQQHSSTCLQGANHIQASQSFPRLMTRPAIKAPPTVGQSPTSFRQALLRL